MARHDALGVATWFLAWAEGEDAPVSNLKLQKLLYYAQGHCLGLNHAPLFDDRIEAWAHGPVVPTVYHRFKASGSRAIELDAELAASFDWDEYRDVEQLLIRVWNTYGPYDAWALRNRTHGEAPWVKAFAPDERAIEISQASLEAFFTEK